MIDTTTQIGTEDWSPVLENWKTLERYSKRVTRSFRGIEPDEVLHDLAVDLVHSAHLYDPNRGPYLAWAWTRARLAGLRHRRKRDTHEPLGRESLGASVDDEGGTVDPAIGVGVFGSADRSETVVDLVHLYARATPLERDVLICELQGLRTTKVTRTKPVEVRRVFERSERLGIADRLRKTGTWWTIQDVAERTCISPQKALSHVVCLEEAGMVWMVGQRVSWRPPEAR